MHSVIVLTSEFPYGSGESFLETELPILANYFDKVYIAPLYSHGDLREIPTNSQILRINGKNKGSKIKSILYFLKQIQFKRKRLAHLKNMRQILSMIQNQIGIGQELQEILKREKCESKTSVLYSYWFDDWVGAVTWTKELNEFQFVSRAHGFDLYDYRNPSGFISMRNVHLKRVQKVLPISADGKSYLEKEFPENFAKIELHRLGTKINSSFIPKSSSEDNKVIVSCSSVIELKRVALIAESLKKLSVPLTWHHFGDGPLFLDLKKIVDDLPKNINVVLHGHTNNKEVLEFYENTPVDLFVNVSVYEGIPVSIMEALSFGIPILATEVGGVSEIVNDKNGNLINVDLNSDAICTEIGKMLASVVSVEKKLEIINDWKTKFSEENYHRTAKMMASL